MARRARLGLRALAPNPEAGDSTLLLPLCHDTWLRVPRAQGRGPVGEPHCPGMAPGPGGEVARPQHGVHSWGCGEAFHMQRAWWFPWWWLHAGRGGARMEGRGEQAPALGVPGCPQEVFLERTGPGEGPSEGLCRSPAPRGGEQTLAGSSTPSAGRGAPPDARGGRRDSQDRRAGTWQPCREGGACPSSHKGEGSLVPPQGRGALPQPPATDCRSLCIDCSSFTTLRKATL